MVDELIDVAEPRLRVLTRKVCRHHDHRVLARREGELVRDERLETRDDVRHVVILERLVVHHGLRIVVAAEVEAARGVVPIW